MSKWMRTVLALGWMLSTVNISQGVADDREVFLYQDGTTTGAVIHDRGLRWVENVGGLEKFYFQEVQRNDDMIELLGRGRDVGLKIYADKGELRLPRSTRWSPWQNGRWIDRADLPPDIPFVPADQKLRLVYFVPQDREAIENYAQRIRVVMELVADIYRQALQENGVASDGFELETDEAGLPIVHLVRTTQPARYYNGAPKFHQGRHFQRIGAELPATVGAVRRHMLVAFAETYEPGPAPIEWDGSVGVGAHATADGGLAVMSSWILRDEFCAPSFEELKAFLLDTTPIVGRTAFGTRRPDSPRFEFIEDGFGAVAHELGHALGLPHDQRQPQNLMGRGFRSLQINYLTSPGTRPRVTFSRDNCRLLAVSRYLMPMIDVSDDTIPTGELKFESTSDSEVLISLTARDDRELRAVVFVDLRHDTVIGSAELAGKEHSLQLTLPVRRPNEGLIKLQAKVADASGNITSVSAEAR